VGSTRGEGHTAALRMCPARARGWRTAVPTAPSPRDVRAAAPRSHAAPAPHLQARRCMTRMPTTRGGPPGPGRGGQGRDRAPAGGQAPPRAPTRGAPRAAPRGGDEAPAAGQRRRWAWDHEPRQGVARLVVMAADQGQAQVAGDVRCRHDPRLLVSAVGVKKPCRRDGLVRVMPLAWLVDAVSPRRRRQPLARPQATGPNPL
jgi:hypothetical protein